LFYFTSVQEILVRLGIVVLNAPKSNLYNSLVSTSYVTFSYWISAVQTGRFAYWIRLYAS